MPFFKFEMMREIKDWNPLIGAPMQAAMRRDIINAACLIYDQEMMIQESNYLIFKIAKVDSTFSCIDQKH